MDDRRTDGGTNFILRIKEQERHLTLNEHDDDDDDEIVLYEMPDDNSWGIETCRSVEN